MRKRWWTITYYSSRYGFNSKIQVSDNEIGSLSIESYAKLICGNRELWWSIENSKR